MVLWMSRVGNQIVSYLHSPPANLFKCEFCALCSNTDKIKISIDTFTRSLARFHRNYGSAEPESRLENSAVASATLHDEDTMRRHGTL